MKVAVLKALKRVIGCLVCLSAAPVMAQVYKCTDKSGATAYQSIPCPGQALKGEQIKLQVPPSDPEALARRAKTIEARASQPASKPVEQAPLAAQPAPPPKSELEVLSETCLDWYRPLLKDPRGAYYRDASYKDNVLTFTIYGTNSYGGYVTKVAQCEIKRGAIDEAWTKTLAKRHSWAVQ